MTRTDLLNKKVDKLNNTSEALELISLLNYGECIAVLMNTKNIPSEIHAALMKRANVLNQIITKLESVGSILAKVTRTAYKGGVTIPKSTVKPVATWTAQGKGSDKQKQDTSGTVTFAYHKLRCAVAVSLEVDTMAITAFENLLINNIVEAMTKALEQAIISGTGAGQPKGITAETADAGQTVETSKPAYADLITAEGNLPVAYEKGAEWCMSKKTYMNYYGLLDSNGQPIGRINYGLAGKPEYTLLGRPVYTIYGRLYTTTRKRAVLRILQAGDRQALTRYGP